MCSIKIKLHCLNCNTPCWVAFEPNRELDPMLLAAAKPWTCILKGCERLNQVEWQKWSIQSPTHPIPVSEVCKPIEDKKPEDPKKIQMVANIKRILRDIIYRNMGNIDKTGMTLFDYVRDFQKLTGKSDFWYKGCVSVKVVPKYECVEPEILELE